MSTATDLNDTEQDLNDTEQDSDDNTEQDSNDTEQQNPDRTHSKSGSPVDDFRFASSGVNAAPKAAENLVMGRSLSV